MGKTASVEGTGYAGTRDLLAEKERLLALIPRLQGDHLSGDPEALGQLNKAEAALEEISARIVKRRAASAK